MTKVGYGAIFGLVGDVARMFHHGAADWLAASHMTAAINNLRPATTNLVANKQPNNHWITEITNHDSESITGTININNNLLDSMLY